MAGSTVNDASDEEEEGRATAAEESTTSPSHQQMMAAALETLQRRLYSVNDSADAHMSYWACCLGW